jgi:hypothetical protein
MIGFYIIVRMFSFVLRGGDRTESMFVKVISSLTIVATIVIMIMLTMASADISSLAY